MSGSHKEFPKKAVFIQLGLAALVGLGFLLADKPTSVAMADKITKPIVAAAAKILKPVGQVEVKEEKISLASRSGKEVYDTTCGICHNSGVAGAPKLDDKDSWENRLSGGFSALVASAIKGKGGMPPRGGNPDNTDSEIELAISHMIKTAGIKLVAKSASNSDSVAATTSEEKPAVAIKTEEAPKTVETPQAEEVITEVADKVEEVKTEVAEKADEKVEELITKKEEVNAEAVTPTTTVDHSKGEAVYKNICFACHNTGVAGSPKLGDKAVWAPRIAMGSDSLHQSAINGKGAMPAKGGNTSISDEDIKAAVDYMTAQSM